MNVRILPVKFNKLLGADLRPGHVVEGYRVRKVVNVSCREMVVLV